MQFGAHLPLIDFTGDSWQPDDLNAYVDAARDSGFDAISANDHLVFQKPWLDGLVALSSVIHRTGNMMLATTVALPVVRHPIALAKQAAAIDILSGGRLVLGIGPGSSSRDYSLVGLDFEERWKRFDEAVRVLRYHLCGDDPVDGSYYPSTEVLEPKPKSRRPIAEDFLLSPRPSGERVRERGIPIWLGSWGSDAGLRRVARLADGWLASAYNTTPAELARARAALHAELRKHGKDPEAFPCALATMWTYVTDSSSERDAQLSKLSRLLNRPPDALAEQVLIGPADECAARLRAYADAGVSTVFIWPLADATDQLQRFMSDVAPLV